MQAQELYNYREESAKISGNELHEVFLAVCGVPSPSGKVEISTEALAFYAAEQRQRYATHKAGGGVGGGYLIDVAEFCEALI